MMDNRIDADLCVIGGGSGGLSVAAGAAQMGARVVLLECGKMGGDCLNTGCIPSKSLIAAGKHAREMTTGKDFGIAPTTPIIDYAAVQDHVASVISAIEPHDSVERFESLGVRVIQEFGAFTGRKEIIAGGISVRARRFVIATGSVPFIPPIPGLSEAGFETNETIFGLEKKPTRLIVIGGGPIGMELAQAHTRLGCEVTIIEAEKVLGRSLRAHAELVRNQLQSEGAEILEGVSVSAVQGERGRIKVETSNGKSLSGTHLLVAAGRRPDIARLNLDVAGVATSNGAIMVGRSLRTSNRRIYAIGDATGGLQFTHVAGYHAGIVVQSALLGLPARARTDCIPSVTFTDPELAEVGMTEEEANQRFGGGIEIATAEFADNDRARAERTTCGQVRVIVRKGRPIGASIAGPHAGELIQTWCLAIASRLKMADIAKSIAPYPTLGEVNKRVAGNYFSKRLFGNPKIRMLVGIVQRF